jgi:hypothetical protein
MAREQIGTGENHEDERKSEGGAHDERANGRVETGP